MRDIIYIQDGHNSQSSNSSLSSNCNSNEIALNSIAHDFGDSMRQQPNAITPYSDFSKSRLGITAGKWFVLTINLKDKTDAQVVQVIRLIQQNAFNNSNTEYCCFGRERGRLGTLHLQCYIALKMKRRIAIVLRDYFAIWQHKCWPYIAKAWANALKNKTYCSKDNNFFQSHSNLTDKELDEIGPKQGKRSNLDDFKKMVDDNPWHSDFEFMTDHFNVSMRFVRGCEKYINLARMDYYRKNFATSARGNGCEVHVYWGPSGTGKTFKAVVEAEQICREKGWDPQKDIYHKTVAKWWNGLEGARIIIIDDFRSNLMQLNEFLKMVDNQPYQREQKGLISVFRAAYFFITCPKPPSEWYPKAFEREGGDNLRAQLERRCHCIREFDQFDNPEYAIKVAARLRKRNREGFVIEDNPRGSEAAPPPGLGGGRAPGGGGFRGSPLNDLRNIAQSRPELGTSLFRSPNVRLVERQLPKKKKKKTSNRVRSFCPVERGTFTTGGSTCWECHRGEACYKHNNNLPFD